MAVINILDKHVAELIAAGEVVEKPASVVKELVENSIDAGANKIIVDIENGGIKKILVQDNGSGIDSEYVRTAFVRHATSKINDEKDLDTIQSLGFRGEALASISSVSKLELITQTEDQDFAIEIKLEGSEEISFEVKPFVQGTRFIIRDLFFNTPARMKFLKRDFTEAGYIQDILTNLALSCPSIAFTFKKDGKTVFTTLGDGNLLNTVASLFGYEFSKQLTETDFSDGNYTVKGLVSYPHFSKQSRNMQFSFINGRFVKNKTVIAAVENAYKGTVMTGKFPAYILNINMPFELIDVNVHPAKTEVRFANEKDIFNVVYRAVKSSIMQNEKLKEFSFAKNDFKIENPEENNVKQFSLTDSAKPHEVKEKQEFVLVNTSLKTNDKVIDFNKKYIVPSIQKEPEEDDFLISSSSLNYSKNEYKKENIEIDNTTSYNSLNFLSTTENKINKETQDISNEIKEQTYSVNVLGEIYKTYILCMLDDEFVIIDKHAAHERILYERYKKNSITKSQMLLVPVSVKLSAKEKEAILDNLDLLNSQGFEVDDFGMDSIALRSVPMDISMQDPENLIGEIAFNLANDNKLEISEKLEWIFHSVACRSAIKAGDNSHKEELTQLIIDMKNEKIPLFCPHGRPVMITITQKELEKQFGR